MLITLAAFPCRGRNRTGSRTAPKPYLTDEQWLVIEDLFPWQRTTPWGGRPLVPPRECLEGILWILISGARWKDLPERYPSPSTCWRRLNQWVVNGVFKQAWARLLGKLDRFHHINWRETIGDGTFAPAKKGGDDVGKTKKGKGTKIMILVDGEGIPLAANIASASEAEVNLIEPLVESSLLACKCRPQRLMYDRAADSDPLRESLAANSIELICPHRRNRKRPPTQDGRKLRRYKRRYRVERTISWLGTRRRLLVRYEYWNYIFEGFVQLACLFTILQRF